MAEPGTRDHACLLYPANYILGIGLNPSSDLCLIKIKPIPHHMDPPVQLHNCTWPAHANIAPVLLLTRNGLRITNCNFVFCQELNL